MARSTSKERQATGGARSSNARPRQRTKAALLFVAAAAIALALTTALRQDTVTDEAYARTATVQAAEAEPEDAELATVATLDAARGRMAATDSVGSAAAPNGEGAATAGTFAITGTVDFPDGFPIVDGIPVYAWPLEGSDPPTPGTTKPDASFYFEGLTPGRYTVSARARFVERVASGQSRTFVGHASGTRSDVLVPLREYFAEGFVSDRDGTAVGGLDLSYSWSSANDAQGWQSREADRAHSELPFVAGSYQEAATEKALQTAALTVPKFWTTLGNSQGNTGALINASADTQPESVDLIAGGPSDLQGFEGQLLGSNFEDIQAQLEQLSLQEVFEVDLTTALSGRLVDDPPSIRKLSTIQSGWLASDQLWDRQSNRKARRGGSVRTDAFGYYRVPLEGPGQVTITAPMHPKEEGPRWIQQSRSEAATPDAPALRLDFQLLRSASVEGRVATPDGASQGIDLFLRSVTEDDTTNREAGEDGRFRYRDLTPGKYLLYARTGGESGQDYCVHRKLDVPEGGTVYVDEMLTMSSSVIGSVVDAGGAPVQGVQVMAKGSDNASLTRSANTDEFGHFTITGMYACDYRLSVRKRALQSPVEARVPPRGARIDVGTLVVDE